MDRQELALDESGAQDEEAVTAAAISRCRAFLRGELRILPPSHCLHERYRLALARLARYPAPSR